MNLVIDDWSVRRILAGWDWRACGMTRRTWYRWRRDLTGLERVEVGGYKATYGLRRNGPPVRVSDWEPA